MGQPVEVSDDLKAITKSIAEQLQERKYGSRQQIYQIAQICGLEFVQQALHDALDLNAQGGIPTSTGNRQRTLGGIFFHLVRSRLTLEQLEILFPERAHRWKEKAERQLEDCPVQPLPPVYLPFIWNERDDILEGLFCESGEAATVKVTLIGRPGKIEKRQNLVITTMRYAGKTPALPKGVPQPPATWTSYAVYIAMKQWNRVEEAIRNPEDILIVEGFSAFDPLINGMAVYAQNVTTKLLDQAKRQQQKQQVTQAVEAEIVEPTPEPMPEYLQPLEEYIPANVPRSVVVKLQELYAATKQFQLKLAALEKKPVNQRPGYDMTRKLLNNTFQQIDTILREYNG